MNFGELIHDLQTNAKKVIRKIERTERKLQKAKSALVFNETCINEDILPKYTNMYIYIYIYIYIYRKNKFRV